MGEVKDRSKVSPPGSKEPYPASVTRTRPGYCCDPTLKQMLKKPGFLDALRLHTTNRNMERYLKQLLKEKLPLKSGCAKNRRLGWKPSHDIPRRRESFHHLFNRVIRESERRS